MFEFLDTSDLAYADLVNCAAGSLLAVFLLIFCIDDKYKKTKKILFILSTIFFALEGLSMMTVMSDINYQFLVNLFDFTNFIAVFETNIFREYILLCLGVFFAALLLLYFIYKKVKITNKKIRYTVVTICVLFLCTPFSFVFKFSKTMFNIFHNPDYKKSYEILFKEITGKEFVKKKDLSVELPENPKNLVFIMLESFEENFMNSNVFGDIAKDVKNIANNSEYYSGIPEIEGSGWTMAGIHTLMCGSPRLYNIRKNKLFKTVTVSELVCLPDVLKKAGYYQLYLGGEFKDFAGKSFFLDLHGYNRVYGDKEIFAEYDIAEKDRWGWGAKDIDVFKIAKDKYIELNKSGKPFNLTFSTICSHAPGGIYDDRCRGILQIMAY